MAEPSIEHQRSHPLVEGRDFKSIESYVLHLMHQRAYEEACRYAKDKRVLDWGCNDGYGIEIMHPYTASISGLDVAPHAVEAARDRFGPNGPRIELFDGARSPFDDASFDLITSFQLIEHISDYQPFFAEMVRLLAPGGIALFTTPNGTQRLNPGMAPWNEFHAREFSPRELRELLEARFTRVEIFGMVGEILSIERARIDRIKAQQRGRLDPPKAPPPLPKRTWLDRLLRRPPAKKPANQPPKPSPPSSAELSRYSTRDLAYTSADVEGALDLLAVCSDPKV